MIVIIKEWIKEKYISGNQFSQSYFLQAFLTLLKLIICYFTIT